MTEEALYSLRFPIGEFDYPTEVNSILLKSWITIIADFPNALKEVTNGISDTQKNWKYRPDGWSLKQVVHHCADSHLNSIIRFKSALTEDSPTIHPYPEEKWALLSDSLEDDLTDSLQLLSGMHSKWSRLLTGLTQDQLERTYVHPDREAPYTLKEAIALYAWHCSHHLGHVKLALLAEGKYD